MGQRVSRSSRGARAVVVGQDQYGNRYLEQQASDAGRPRRWMKPPGLFAVPLKYDPEKVPAPWRSWLAFQREHPPSG